MAKLKKTTNPSWRAIEQTKLKRGVTPQARMKRLKWVLKVLMGCLGLAVFGGFGWALFKGYQGLSNWMNEVGPARPLARVVFETNGVLTRDWAERLQPFPWGTPLLDVDILSIKAALERDGQVQGVVVDRQFPDTLKLTIREGEPILRLAVKEGKGKPTVYLVERHGGVYKGKNYPQAMLEALPYLEGVQLQKNPMGGFFPIIGMPAVSELLQEARLNYQSIYKQWRSISCERFNGRPEAVGAAIVVKMVEGTTVIFTPESFTEQLDRLAYILQYLKDEAYPKALRIDLTLDDQAAVQLSTGRLTVPKRASALPYSSR